MQGVSRRRAKSVPIYQYELASCSLVRTDTSFSAGVSLYLRGISVRDELVLTSRAKDYEGSESPPGHYTHMLPWASRVVYMDNSDSHVLEGNRLRRNPMTAHFSAGASFSADGERRDKKAPSSTLCGASPLRPATFSYQFDWWVWCRGEQMTFSCRAYVDLPTNIKRHTATLNKRTRRERTRRRCFLKGIIAAITRKFLRIHPDISKRDFPLGFLMLGKCFQRTQNAEEPYRLCADNGKNELTDLSDTWQAHCANETEAGCIPSARRFSVAELGS